jgi:hypothetical protein
MWTLPNFTSGEPYKSNPLPRDVGSWLQEELEAHERNLRLKSVARKFRENVKKAKEARILEQVQQHAQLREMAVQEAVGKFRRTDKAVTLPALPAQGSNGISGNSGISNVNAGGSSQTLFKGKQPPRQATAELLQGRYQTWYANSKYAQSYSHPSTLLHTVSTSLAAAQTPGKLHKKDIKLDCIYHSLPSYELTDDTSIPEKLSLMLKRPLGPQHPDHEKRQNG